MRRATIFGGPGNGRGWGTREPRRHPPRFSHAGDAGIHGFRVAGNGSLTAVAGATVTGVLPISVTGLAAY